MKSMIAVCVILCSFLMTACSTRTAAEAAGQAPTRRELRRAMMQAPAWRFVYCAKTSEEEAALKDLLQEISATQPGGKRIEILNCTELTAEILAEGQVTLFGNVLPDGYDVLLSPEGDNYLFDGRHPIGADDALLVPYYRNPWNDGASVVGLYFARQIKVLIATIKSNRDADWGDFFWTRYAYEIHRPGGSLVYGSFSDSTWQFDAEAEILLDHPEEPIVADGDLTMFSFDGEVTAGEAREVTNALRYAQASAKAVLGDCVSIMPEVRLYPNIERIGLRTQAMHPVQFDRDRAVIHIVPSWFSDENLAFNPTLWSVFTGNCLAQSDDDQRDLLVAYTQFRAPKSTNQQTLFNSIISNTLRFWATDISIDNRVRDETHRSDIIDRFRALSRVQSMVDKDAADFLKSLPQVVVEITSPGVPIMVKRESDFPRYPTKPLPTTALAGMTFAHEGYQTHNGYGGTKVKASLDSLSHLAVNAVAIVPYTFQRDPSLPAPFHLPSGAGSENDAATTYAIREAGKRGQYVLLKPQIWVRGGWPGDIRADTLSRAEEWFDHYHYWIMHYALLAEAEGVDGLCIGTELVRMTLDHPDRWRTIIADLRKVYSGHLTYAANWGEEFENLTFWDDLDVIGLNSYYPLSEKASPTDAELTAGAERWMAMAAEVARRHDKPLWLTETGYRSVARAWQNPHADAGDRPSDPDAQRRCYDALLRAAGRHPELRGIFIWKWPSYLGYEGGRRSDNTGFTPGGKPAADRLAAFYKGWR